MSYDKVIIHFISVLSGDCFPGRMRQRRWIGFIGRQHCGQRKRIGFIGRQSCDQRHGGGTTPTGVAKLSWAAPTNADGTPFTDIAGFKVYYGTSPGTYSSSINVGMTTSYSVNGLAPGTYYFTVTTCDSSGNESGFSNEAAKQSSDRMPCRESLPFWRPVCILHKLR